MTDFSKILEKAKEVEAKVKESQEKIKQAHSNAKNQLKSKTSDEISKATGGFGIPGFKWPL